MQTARGRSIEETIGNVVSEKTFGRVAPGAVGEDAAFSVAGLSLAEIYECIVGVEDIYHVVIEDGDGSAMDWTPSSLAQCIRSKLHRKSYQTINWKDAFESLVFTGKTPRLSAPLVAHLDITFRCNCRCIFCYDSSGSGQPGLELSTGKLMEVIDEFAELSVVQITFGGGEAFIRKDFIDIVRHARRRNIRSYILTNGTLITREKAGELGRFMNPGFDMVQVSLDGPTAEIHDKQRGVKGTFEKTMAGINNLREAGIMPVINCVLTQINYNYIPQMIDFLVENRLYSFRLLRLHPLGRGKDLGFFNSLRLTAEQSEKTFELLEEKRRELIGTLHITDDYGCIFPMSVPKVRSRVTPIPGREPESYACGAGTSMVSIGPDGGVYPCSYMYEFPELRIGSIRENTLKELWDNDALWTPYRKPLRPSGKCVGCEYLHSCKTGCRILSYAVHGDMGAPDPGCFYAPGSAALNPPGIQDVQAQEAVVSRLSI